MKITFLGTGTSQGVPIIACTCEVCRSADPKDKRLRSSVLITEAGKNVVIDSGPDFRQQMLRAGVMDLEAVLYTHEHKDHVAGIDDVRAFNFIHNKSMPLWASKRVQEAIKREVPYCFDGTAYPGIPRIELFTIGHEPFSVSGIEFIPIDVLHHRLPVKAFRCGDFTYITDANSIPPAEKKKIKGSRILVLNALRRESHISHFTLDQAIELALEFGAEMTYLTHISHQLGKHADVMRELPAGIELAYDGLEVELH
ncbi:MAG TPA: MBL fold metallo-hydrolase [Bacteroidia bacterium]|jgi:phosphoribosyl 1,2-cyclic phosphate phosphodiesterase|nr:MBL fold metallo-hydrolase [Bacteroidia bacterium]